MQQVTREDHGEEYLCVQLHLVELSTLVHTVACNLFFYSSLLNKTINFLSYLDINKYSYII